VELIWANPESLGSWDEAVVSGVQRCGVGEVCALPYFLCSLSNSCSCCPISDSLYNQVSESAASRGPGKPAKGWKYSR
jgi:hypothetical protein